MSALEIGEALHVRVSVHIEGRMFDSEEFNEC